jgi:hypothetical protein
MFPGYWEVWVNHFEYHARNRIEIAPGVSDLLTSGERRRIGHSIATFQLGQQSEGRVLLRAADDFARTHRLPELLHVVELLIHEKSCHAAMLQRFMADHGIVRRRIHWTDSAFRRLRRLAGLEWYLHVLLGAEFIGVVYYRALESVTRCQRLRILCRAIVADQLAHVGFESELLLALQARRGDATRALLSRAHRLFVAGAAGIVWLTHRPVLHAAGHDARGFIRACLARHAFYLDSPVVTGGAGSSL